MPSNNLPPASRAIISALLEGVLVAPGTLTAATIADMLTTADFATSIGRTIRLDESAGIQLADLTVPHPGSTSESLRDITQLDDGWPAVFKNLVYPLGQRACPHHRHRHRFGARYRPACRRNVVFSTGINGIYRSNPEQDEFTPITTSTGYVAFIIPEPGRRRWPRSLRRRSPVAGGPGPSPEFSSQSPQKN